MYLLHTVMKTLLITLILAILMSCSEGETVEPQSEKGCLTGIINGKRAFIRCCTRQEYLAGSNVNQGGTSTWNNYTAHQWTPVSDCSECY